MKRICENCLNKDEDWFDKQGHITKIPFCAANRPEFPAAVHCQHYEPRDVADE